MVQEQGGDDNSKALSSESLLVKTPNLLGVTANGQKWTPRKGACNGLNNEGAMQVRSFLQLSCDARVLKAAHCRPVALKVGEQGPSSIADDGVLLLTSRPITFS